ncbi:long-chain fatty acid--CoA ligase [Phytohabitans sp. ZYX-F-186]|uniref:Long-chain fatty acid--CoA ligase n=1 Tax=Phytohabitans maris TaxID=3071409 RepID=A0ABU0ZAF0_9ACTN|nr:long-chain fatty acid--CoA ligase [Phytohabitans sp. ZYX-F-186]MDQ7904038.1 long-chain fatty acid--CoA ligase [Phytohabitans sp. ZYX-F-186]
MFPGPVLAALRAAPDRPAFEAGTRVVTRGELLALVGRCVSGLRAAGLGPGSGVGMALPSTPEAYAAHLAAHALGCRVAAMRPGWSPEQRDHARADVDVLVGEEELDRLAAGPEAPVPALARPDGVARLTYTSGSTGLPKACAHTYAAISLAYRPDTWAPALAGLMARFDRCLVAENLASPVMFTYLGRCLVVGGTVVLPDGLGLAEAVERTRPTATMMPPARLHQVLAEGADLSGLRAVVLGGSPASPGLLRAAVDRLGPVVWQGYGQGEAGVIAMLTPEDVAAGHEASVGRPLPAVRVEIRDGEVWVRSPHMMTGYWNDPERTAEVLRDGWLRTRDLGHLDGGGMLHLTGRARDVIMVNAEVCYAGAIERVLATHPAVAQAYVVGAPDPVTGEAIHAFVVPAGEHEPDRAALVDLVGRRLSANSVPRTVTVIREVPMSASGKPDKTALLHRTRSSSDA